MMRIYVKKMISNIGMDETKRGKDESGTHVGVDIFHVE